MKTLCLAVTMAAFFLCCGASAMNLSPNFQKAVLIPHPAPTSVEQRIIELLRSRLGEYGVETAIGDAPDSQGLSIFFGAPDRHPELASLCETHRIPPLDVADPGPEGYRLKLAVCNGAPALLAACMDARGMLYAVGEILRQGVTRGGGVAFPAGLDVRGVARFPIRGLNVFQGHTITELTGARQWTDEEWQRAVIEYALAGANTFELGYSRPGDPMFAFIKSYGLDTMFVPVANAGSGPPEWQAVEAIGRSGYLCPSIPEARQALLEQYDRRFAGMASFDYVHWKSGDGGGCECEKCKPFGEKFVHLCEDLTRVLHRHHPDTAVFIGNQKLDNAGDNAMFAYLREALRPWMRGVVYGPGSNAMGWMPGRRQDHRSDLFTHARFGQIDGYLREMLHQLPPEQSILFFTDLTHWVYSQYGLMDHELIADMNHALPPAWDRWLYERKPDRAMQRVYDRRTFHARPRHYHEIFQYVMRYGIGDVAYSEGHHDHLNQWMWQRLMWNPLQRAEEVVGAYCRYHFGADAADIMRDAIFQHEDNLSAPIADNPGIDRFNERIAAAKALIPEYYMQKDYLWRQYAQKGLVDKYIQLRLRRQQALWDAVTALLADALDSGEAVPALLAAQQRFGEPAETPEMARIKSEAERLGRESDAAYGVRNEGLFNLDQDFVGLGWLEREIQRAIAAGEPAAADRVIRRIVHYEDPGEGGFYDDAGNPERSPNLSYGQPYGDGIFSGANRLSQRSMAFTTDEAHGVTFDYFGLDPGARYRVRMTLVRPRYLPRFGVRQPQTRQSIYADEHLLAEALELPEYEADFFEFEVPQAATADGKLRLWFKKQAGIGEGSRPDVTIWRNTGGWGTLVSEVWLIKIQDGAAQ